jgi:hypothetical protein
MSLAFMDGHTKGFCPFEGIAVRLQLPARGALGALGIVLQLLSA